MDTRYDVIIASSAGGSIRCSSRRGRLFQPPMHSYAGGAVKLIGPAAKTAGTDLEVMT